MLTLYRSQEHRMIAGICGGIGEQYGIDPNIIRLALVFVSMITVVGILPAVVTYVVGWAILPVGPGGLNR